jgi:hypothetical protein
MTIEDLFGPALDFLDSDEERREAFRFYSSLESGEREAFFKVLLTSPPIQRKKIYMSFVNTFNPLREEHS